MFKALDVRDNTEIVILDPKWLRSISQLRQLDYQDFLVCQGCKQSVRVRAGEQRREHFAHKHLGNCDYAEESAILRNTRAILYEWLVSKFSGNVTIEKKVDGIDLFRPIDCWVEKDSRFFAYWIFDSRLKLEKREILRSRLEKLGIHVNWVFALEMLHTEPDHSDSLVLSTTERDFIRRSKYDIAYGSSFLTISGSLHYMDADNRKLHTFRGLSLYHEPQVYKGYTLSSELEKVLVAPHNGEFVHSGEFDKLQEYERRQKITHESSRHQWERFASPRNTNFLGRQVENYQLKSDNNQEEKSIFSEWQDKPSIPPQRETKSGTCVFCGETTQDWWWYDGKTGQCKCRSCLKQGKS
jgi:hypothetical protein